MARTDWQMGDTVQPADMNQIGQEINDAVTAAGNAQDAADAAATAARNAQDAANAAASAAANAQSTADSAASAAAAAQGAAVAAQNEIDSHKAATNVHGATSAATANRLVLRDASGRAKVAAPAASDDIARKAEVDAHAGRTDNPHSVTKAQVGLGSVQNYGIATQAQAEAGSANNVYMTPLRTKNYVDTKLLNNLQFRVNAGNLEYNDGVTWKKVGASDSTPTILTGSPPSGALTQIVNLTNTKGVLCKAALGYTILNASPNNIILRVRVTVDGAIKLDLWSNVSYSGDTRIAHGLYNIGAVAAPRLPGRSTTVTGVGASFLIVPYPYTSSSAQSSPLICPLEVGIPFENSLRIEIAGSTSAIYEIEYAVYD